MGGRRQQVVPSEGEPAGQLLVGKPHAHQTYLLGAGEGPELATFSWHGQSSLLGPARTTALERTLLFVGW